MGVAEDGQRLLELVLLQLRLALQEVQGGVDRSLLALEVPPESAGVPPWNPEAYVYWLMDHDRKSTGLKSLQGRIWEAGYQSGELKGKLAYMAPEQVRGKGVTRAVDVYAAGIILWELLTGRRMFKAENDAEVMFLLLTQATEAPRCSALPVP